jgi:flagellar basal-body rod modification protein FlgD
MSTPLGGIRATSIGNALDALPTPTATPSAGRGEMPVVPLTSGSAAGTMSSQQAGATSTPPASTLPASSAASSPSSASTGSTGATGSTGSSGSTSSANSMDSTISSLAGTDTFLQLLVAQMQNQDPTSPMDDQSFVTELAQFNTVEQMLSLKQTVSSQVVLQQQLEGIGLLGKNVTYATPSLDGQSTTTNQGTVSSVSVDQGAVNLTIGSQQVPLSEVTTVS